MMNYCEKAKLAIVLNRLKFGLSGSQDM